VDRAVARSELPAGTEPAALVELLVGPALLRLLLMGQRLDEPEIVAIVRRAIASLREPDAHAASASSERG